MFRSFCRALKKFSLAVGAQRTEGPLACGDPIKQIILCGVNASSKAIEKFEADAVLVFPDKRYDCAVSRI